MTDINEWEAGEGGFARLLEGGTPRVSYLLVVVPRGWKSEVDSCYDAIREQSYGDRQVVPLHELAFHAEAAWFVRMKAQQVCLKLQLRKPALADIVITLDAVDPDWRRMLFSYYRFAERGATPTVVLLSSWADLESFEAAVDAGDWLTAGRIGLPVYTYNMNVLRRLEKIEATLTDEQRRAAGFGNHPLALHFRHKYNSIIDIDPLMGGGAAILLNGFPAFVIDLGYEDQGIWDEAAFRQLLSLGFSRVSSFDHVFPTAIRWFAVLMPHHLAIIYCPQPGDLSQLEVLYSGPLGASNSWRQMVLDQLGIPILVGNLGLLSQLEVDTGGAISDAVLFQRAVGASILAIDVDVDELSELLPCSPESEEFVRRLKRAWASAMSIRLERQPPESVD
jgi:hypothetical protein